MHSYSICAGSFDCFDMAKTVANRLPVNNVVDFLVAFMFVHICTYIHIHIYIYIYVYVRVIHFKDSKQRSASLRPRRFHPRSQATACLYDLLFSCLLSVCMCMLQMMLLFSCLLSLCMCMCMN